MITTVVTAIKGYSEVVRSTGGYCVERCTFRVPAHEIDFTHTVGKAGRTRTVLRHLLKGPAQWLSVFGPT